MYTLSCAFEHSNSNSKNKISCSLCKYTVYPFNRVCFKEMKASRIPFCPPWETSCIIKVFPFQDINRVCFLYFIQRKYDQELFNHWDPQEIPCHVLLISVPTLLKNILQSQAYQLLLTSMFRQMENRKTKHLFNWMYCFYLSPSPALMYVQIQCLFSLSRDLFCTKYAGSLLNCWQEVSAYMCACYILCQGDVRHAVKARLTKDGRWQSNWLTTP